MGPVRAHSLDSWSIIFLKVMHGSYNLQENEDAGPHQQMRLSMTVSLLSLQPFRWPQKNTSLEKASCGFDKLRKIRKGEHPEGRNEVRGGKPKKLFVYLAVKAHPGIGLLGQRGIQGLG